VPEASGDITTGKCQPPIGLEATILDDTHTLLDTAFNDCDDVINKDNNSNEEQTAVVKSVTEDQVSLLRAAVHCQRYTILKLQQQLRSVLPVLGIIEQNIQLTGIDESKPTNNTATCQADMVDHAAVQSQWDNIAADTQLPKVPHPPELGNQTTKA